MLKKTEVNNQKRNSKEDRPNKRRKKETSSNAENNTSTTVTLEILCHDVLLNIFRYLTPNEILIASLVCKLFSFIANTQPTVWYLSQTQLDDFIKWHSGKQNTAFNTQILGLNKATLFHVKASQVAERLLNLYDNFYSAEGILKDEVFLNEFLSHIQTSYLSILVIAKHVVAIRAQKITKSEKISYEYNKCKFTILDCFAAIPSFRQQIDIIKYLAEQPMTVRGLPQLIELRFITQEDALFIAETTENVLYKKLQTNKDSVAKLSKKCDEVFHGNFSAEQKSEAAPIRNKINYITKLLSEPQIQSNTLQSYIERNFLLYAAIRQLNHWKNQITNDHNVTKSPGLNI